MYRQMYWQCIVKSIEDTPNIALVKHNSKPAGIEMLLYKPPPSSTVIFIGFYDVAAGIGSHSATLALVSLTIMSGEKAWLLILNMLDGVEGCARHRPCQVILTSSQKNMH